MCSGRDYRLLLCRLASVSFVFDVDDRTVWSPALRVGALWVRFVGQVGELLGVPTGLSDMASDYYQIDPDVFEALVKKMFEANFASSHPIGRAMLESVLAPSVVILDRIDRPLVADTPEQLAFLQKARNLSMAGDAGAQAQVREAIRHDQTGLTGLTAELLSDLPTNDAGVPVDLPAGTTHVVIIDDTPNPTLTLQVHPVGQPDHVVFIDHTELALTAHHHPEQSAS